MVEISNEIEAWNVFEEKSAAGFSRIFVGDVHVPLIFGERAESSLSACSYQVVYNVPFQFAAADRYIVCVGAVGCSRGGLSKIRYAIYDDEQDTVIFKAPADTLLEF